MTLRLYVLYSTAVEGYVMWQQIVLLACVVASLMLRLGRTPIAGQHPAQQANCPDAPPPRLAVGAYGRVAYVADGQGATPVRVRDAPGKRGKVIEQITETTREFAVIDGPVCQDGY